MVLTMNVVTGGNNYIVTGFGLFFMLEGANYIYCHKMWNQMSDKEREKWEQLAK